MANSSNRDVQLSLKVTTAGAEDVQALAGDLQGVANEGKGIATSLAGGAEALAALAAATRDFRAAESAAAADVAQTKRNIAEYSDELAKLRINYKATGGDAAQFKAAEQALSLSLVDAKANLRDQKDALTSASNAAKAAAVEQRNFATELQRSAAAAAKASSDTKAGLDAVNKSSFDAADTLRRLGPLLASAFGAQQFVETLAATQSLGRSFEVIFGSAERAAQELDFIKGTANKLGVENLVLAKSYQQLAAATKGTSLEGEQTRAVFEAVVKAMSVLGKSSADTELALLAVQQIAGKGVASMEELRRQLGDTLPGAMQAAARGAGITVEQLTGMVTQGTVLASDILPALTKGLNELYANATPPTGIASEWARLKNVFVETTSAVGEGGASKGLAKALSGAAIAVQGASAEVDILGKSLGEMVAAVVTGNYDLATGEQITNKYADALRKSAETAGFAEKAQGALNTALGQGSASATDLFRALERAAAGYGQSAESLLKVKAVYGELAKGSADYTTQIEKEVIARRDEGAALTALVALQGSEIERRQAVVLVTEKQRDAAQRIAQAREVEAVIAQSLSLNLQDEARRRGDTTEATRKEIEAAQKSAAAKNTEAEQAKASAAQKLIEAEAAKVAAAAYQDNATKVYAYRAAAAQAAVEVSRLVELQKQGKATEDQVADARAKAAAATRLYRDALADASAAAERQIRIEQQQAQTIQANISLELERVKAAHDVALALGDSAKAAQLERQQGALQVQAYQEEADAAHRMAQAIRDAAARREEELRASGALTAAMRDELEMQRRSADLKDIEAEKSEVLAKKTRELAQAEQGRNATLEKSIDLQEKALQLAERQRALEERSRNEYDTAGNVVTAQVETLTSIIKTLESYGINEQKARELAQGYVSPNGAINYGAGNNLGGASLSDTLRILAERTLNPAPTVGGTGTQQAAGSTSHTVNINLGGATTAINTASAADSSALVNLLQQLGTAKATAA
jgi:tape measure domain-containing protein